MRGNLRRVRTAVAVGAALTAFGMTAAGTASAAPAGTTAIACANGYLCIQPATSTQPVLVKAGERQSFTPAIQMSEIVNMTGQSYCVTGSMSFGLAHGQSVVRLQTVSSVGPGTFCPN